MALGHEMRRLIKLLGYIEKLTLSHNNAAHEDFNRPNPFEWNFSFPGGLPHPKLMPQLFLRDRVRMVDLVAKDEEGYLGKILHGEEGV